MSDHNIQDEAIPVCGYVSVTDLQHNINPVL